MVDDIIRYCGDLLDELERKHQHEKAFDIARDIIGFCNVMTKSGYVLYCEQCTLDLIIAKADLLIEEIGGK